MILPVTWKSRLKKSYPAYVFVQAVTIKELSTLPCHWCFLTYELSQNISVKIQFWYCLISHPPHTYIYIYIYVCVLVCAFVYLYVILVRQFVYKFKFYTNNYIPLNIIISRWVLFSFRNSLSMRALRFPIRNTLSLILKLQYTCILNLVPLNQTFWLSQENRWTLINY